MKKPECPLRDPWVKEMHYIPTREHYLGLKRKEILQYAIKWTNLEDVMQSEIRQSQKDKYCMIPLF